MNTVLLGVLGVWLLRHVPASARLHVVRRQSTRRAPRTALGPVDVAARRHIDASLRVVVLRRLNRAEELASSLHTVRSVPQTVASAVVHVQRNLADAGSCREGEAVDATERRVPVGGTAVERAHEEVVVTIDSTDTREALGLLVLVGERNPAGLRSSGERSGSCSNLDKSREHYASWGATF